jgi:hypothetical protein
MYGQNSLLIVAILFVSMVAAIELGAWIGMRVEKHASDALRTQINSLQASLLGILALLLGFTFSQSLQRYDARSVAVVEEANAIGTAYLRIGLLPAEVQASSLTAMRNYVETRISAGAISLDRQEERDALLMDGKEIQAQLWDQAVRGVFASNSPATVNLYLQSLNEMIDANASRDAALGRHVPELVLFLLYGTFILTGSLLGYASGISGRRASNGNFVLTILIVVLVFIIIDLDRPRRGFIEVNQSSLTDLRADITD